ncbi:DUF2202 domain-containing protein [Streptomyces sp. NPDC050534]|uniref:DUF2202 domain-containing protein n=1 Tax=Streptomyces sp. NPDC050534 TaxID=3365625 RepID=UPI0037A7A402
MKRNTKIATAVGAGALAVGGLLAVGPVAAGTDTPPAPGSTLQQHMMTGRQHHARQHSDGMHDTRRQGGCTRYTVLAPQGTLTGAQKATLARMAEEEKLAHDLYTSFADRYDVRIFDRIAAAETNHLTAVRTLLNRYDVTDPTTGKGTGDFRDPAVRATYDRLLHQGDRSLSAALKAGRTVEADDITALRHALTGLTAPDARQVYGNLLAASQMHLEMFEHGMSGP